MDLSAVEGDLVEESEARRLAEQFARGLTERWDEWAFVLDLWATPAVTGMFGFTWHPTAKRKDGSPIRVGGNWPILVDQNTSVCRLVQGPDEFAALRGTSAVGDARWTAARRRCPPR